MKSAGEKVPEVLKVYRTVSERILSGEYPAGHRLPETKLAAALGISRTPVRLAIERLVAEGLAEHKPNCGAVVRRMSFEEIRGLLKVREVNEGLAARFASQNAIPDDRKILYGYLQRMEKSLDGQELQEYYTSSRDLHTHIIGMARIPFLSELLERIYMMTYRYHINIMILPGRAPQSREEHYQVVDAVLSGDSVLAETTMIGHIKKITDFYENDFNCAMLNMWGQVDWYKSDIAFAKSP